jgi:integrase
MPREATGELRHLADGFAARITLKGRDRRDFILTTCATELLAEERCKALAVMASRLRLAGHAAEIESMMTMGAKARAGRSWEFVVGAVDALCGGGTRETASQAPTFSKWAEQWTSGELAKKHRDHVKPKSSSDRDEELLRLYVLPHVRDVRVDEFTLNDAEFVMSNVSTDLAPRTRRHVAQVMSRLMNLAVYPGKWIKATPIPRGWLPRPGDDKAKECLYPDEDAKLMAGISVDPGKAGVPLLRRLAYGFLDREAMRTDEMATLRWRDVDLERGRVNLDVNKTDDPRDWDMRPDVVEALKRWKERYQAGATDECHVFAENGIPISVEHLAEQLRRDLWRVGIRRPQLHEKAKGRQRMRAHDLRATFVTISLALGKSETWISDRTGHRSHEMIETYTRKARTWNLGELGPLHALIPELAETEPTTRITPRIPHGFTARVAKQADAADLGSAAARRRGSTPLPCTFAELGKWRADRDPPLGGNPGGNRRVFKPTWAASSGMARCIGARSPCCCAVHVAAVRRYFFFIESPCPVRC